MAIKALAAETLITRLTDMLEHGADHGVFLLARAGTAYCLRSIRTSGNFLSVVLKGRKRIRYGGSVLEIRPGQAVVIAAGCCIDVENIPDSESGEYLAALMILPEEVLAITRTLLGEQGVCGREQPGSDLPCSMVPLADIAVDLERCIEFGTVLTQPRFYHALVGLLLQLHACGIHSCLRQIRPRLADSISLLLATEPAREWRSLDVEDRLAMSGATLRRQLAAEQTSFRQILAETRLGQALQLLQGTRLPVKTVAARAGYRSVSSFVRRFRERYGVAPSKVANSD